MLTAGELALIDKERVLHGWESFDGRAAFVDRDAFHNRWRVLSQRLGHDENKYLLFPGGR